MEYYYIDKLTFATRLKRKDIMPILQTLKPLADSVNIRPNKNPYFPHSNFVDLTALTPECVKQLPSLFPDCNLYKLTYLELAKDTICPDDDSAQTLFLEKKGTEHRKYHKEFRLETPHNKELEEQFLERTTQYAGRKGNQIALYPRKSKIDGSPCLHEEFRYTGARMKKLGITTFNELAKADLHELFEGLHYENIIHYGEFDYFELGNYFKGGKRKRKEKCSQKYIGSCELFAQHLIRCAEDDKIIVKDKQGNIIEHKAPYISDIVTLRMWFDRRKKEIKKYRGTKNPFQNLIINFHGNYRIFEKRELNPIPIQRVSFKHEIGNASKAISC